MLEYSQPDVPNSDRRQKRSDHLGKALAEMLVVIQKKARAEELIFSISVLSHFPTRAISSSRLAGLKEKPWECPLRD